MSLVDRIGTGAGICDTLALNAKATCKSVANRFVDLGKLNDEVAKRMSALDTPTNVKGAVFPDPENSSIIYGINSVMAYLHEEETCHCEMGKVCADIGNNIHKWRHGESQKNQAATGRIEQIFKDYHTLRDKALKTQVAYDKQSKHFQSFLKKVDERKVSDERYQFLSAEQAYQNDFYSAERFMQSRQEELQFEVYDYNRIELLKNSLRDYMLRRRDELQRLMNMVDGTLRSIDQINAQNDLSMYVRNYPEPKNVSDVYRFPQQLYQARTPEMSIILDQGYIGGAIPGIVSQIPPPMQPVPSLQQQQQQQQIYNQPTIAMLPPLQQQPIIPPTPSTSSSILRPPPAPNSLSNSNYSPILSGMNTPQIPTSPHPLNDFSDVFDGLSFTPPQSRTNLNANNGSVDIFSTLESTIDSIHPQNQTSLSTGGSKMMKILYDFDGGGVHGKLTLKAGDLVTNVVDVDDNWYSGHIDGSDGLFPKNYAEEFNPTVLVPDPFTMEDSYKQYKVLFNFDGNPSQGTLSVHEGEVIQCKIGNIEGWLLSKNFNGEEGIVPENYVAIL